jgi:16S rRNA (guanine1516-N2)-methyltransferase
MRVEMQIIATTPQSGLKDDTNFNEFLAESGFSYIPRNRRSLEVLLQENQADGVVVWNNEGPVLYSGGDKFFFHPSMAKNRLSAYRKQGIEDPFVHACGIEDGDSLLDCTLGLGADAIVASYFTPNGVVVGLESSPAIALVVKWGMKLYNSRMSWLNEAIKRIEVINSQHYDYLSGLADNSFDIVYFDPMFRHALVKSQAISPLRSLANPLPLDLRAIEQACRVARKRVVIKERAEGTELERLGCSTIISGKHRKIAFGVIQVGG